jgi:hypothetical protein
LFRPSRTRSCRPTGILAARELPGETSAGPVKDARAYVVNVAGGGRYRRLPAETEAELREAAREFGRLAGLAIRRRFVTSP